MQVNRTITGTDSITLAEAKDFLRVDYSDDDDLITEIIKTARTLSELFTGRALIAQTVEYFTTDTSGIYRLPFPDQSAITEVKVDDAVTTDYTKTGMNQFTVTASVSVSFYAKYTCPGTVPDGMKPIMLKVIADLYENRNDQALSATARAQLLPFKKYN